MKLIILLAIFILGAIPAHAGWLDATKEYGGKALDATIDASKEYGGKALDASKEYGGKALDATIDASKEYGGKALDTTKEVFKETEENKQHSYQQDKTTRFNELWEDVFPKLGEARSVFDELSIAPETSWLNADKKSLRTDLNDLLDEILVLMDDESIVKYRHRLNDLRDRVKEKQNSIQAYREARVTAPVSHTLKTTKAGYDESIKNTELELTDIHEEIDRVTDKFSVKLREVGIDLPTEQIRVLLSRVDSDDIIQMSVVFNVLKEITGQLMELTQSTGENIINAKKYYGMHVILLETIVFMQSKYISQVDNLYIPKLKNIISTTMDLKRTTIKSAGRDTDKNRNAVYKLNAKAQELTIRTAKLYTERLNDYRGQVADARRTAKKNLMLAINTYQTVQMSSELLQLIKESKNSFDTLINLQVPNIVPFENLEMQKKFEELTLEISK